MYLLSQDEYDAMKEKFDDHDKIIKSIKGHHGQINNIEIGEGGRVVIKPSEITAKHVKKTNTSQNHPSQILPHITNPPFVTSDKEEIGNHEKNNIPNPIFSSTRNNEEMDSSKISNIYSNFGDNSSNFPTQNNDQTMHSIQSDQTMRTVSNVGENFPDFSYIYDSNNHPSQNDVSEITSLNEELKKNLNSNNASNHGNTRNDNNSNNQSTHHKTTNNLNDQSAYHKTTLDSDNNSNNQSTHPKTSVESNDRKTTPDNISNDKFTYHKTMVDNSSNDKSAYHKTTLDNISKDKSTHHKTIGDNNTNEQQETTLDNILNDQSAYHNESNMDISNVLRRTSTPINESIPDLEMGNNDEIGRIVHSLVVDKIHDVNNQADLEEMNSDVDDDITLNEEVIHPFSDEGEQMSYSKKDKKKYLSRKNKKTLI